MICRPCNFDGKTVCSEQPPVQGTVCNSVSVAYYGFSICDDVISGCMFCRAAIAIAFHYKRVAVDISYAMQHMSFAVAKPHHHFLPDIFGCYMV